MLFKRVTACGASQPGKPRGRCSIRGRVRPGHEVGEGPDRWVPPGSEEGRGPACQWLQQREEARGCWAAQQWAGKALGPHGRRKERGEREQAAGREGVRPLG